MATNRVVKENEIFHAELHNFRATYGDAEYRQLLLAHRETVSGELVRLGGDPPDRPAAAAGVSLAGLDESA